MRAVEIPSLTALRGIAALVIVIYHFEIFLVPGIRWETVLPLWHWGYLAVDFFFLLSGFVITHVYGDALCERQPGIARTFLIARLARIYPLHLLTLAVLVGVVTTWPPTGVEMRFDRSILPLSLIMQQQWLFNGSWNYPSWSVGDEFLAYIGFVFCARWVLQRRFAIPIALGSIGVLVTICLLKHGSLDTTRQIFGLSRACASFCLGAILYRSWRARPTLILTAAWIVILPAALLGGLLHFDAFWIPAFAGVIIIGAMAQGRWQRLLNTGPLFWLGEISFSIYLWHAPIHFALTGAFASFGIPLRDLGVPASSAVMAGGLALLFTIAWLSFRHYETPARRFINGFRKMRGFA